MLMTHVLRLFWMATVLVLGGCVAGPYGGGTAFGLPSLPDSSNEPVADKYARVSSEYITMNNDEVYHSQVNSGQVQIRLIKNVTITDEDKIYFVYMSPSQWEKIIIAANLIFKADLTTEIPVPDYPATDRRYKDYTLEYADIYLSGTHNVIYLSPLSHFYSSGSPCRAGEEIVKKLYVAGKGAETVAAIRFSLNNGNAQSKYRCDFRTVKGSGTYSQSMALDLGF